MQSVKQDIDLAAPTCVSCGHQRFDCAQVMFTRIVGSGDWEGPRQLCGSCRVDPSTKGAWKYVDKKAAKRPSICPGCRHQFSLHNESGCTFPMMKNNAYSRCPCHLR